MKIKVIRDENLIKNELWIQLINDNDHTLKVEHIFLNKKECKELIRKLAQALEKWDEKEA